MIEINGSMKHLKKKDFKSLLCGFLYFVLCRKNLYNDKTKYFLARWKNRSVNYIQMTVNDRLMYIDLNDIGISMELYCHKKREFFSTEFMKKFLSEDEIVIDIGANIGYYALLESQLINKGEIYAIEPVPSNKDLLYKNVRANNSNNISIFQYAIGDKEGMSKMYIYDRCNWCSLEKNSEITIKEEIDVPIITLDEFVDRHVHKDPTFIRMDVEGYEYHIIKGASKILEKGKHLKLFIEFHPHIMSREKFLDILNILEKNNFKIKSVFCEPESHNYKDMKILNKLRKIMGFPEFGFIGNNYEDINKGVSVFLEREQPSEGM